MAERADPTRHSPYPSRRSRYACENCRRKKSKCPGERPKCSVCDRLKQPCVYMHNIRTVVQDESDRQALHSNNCQDNSQRLPSNPNGTSERLDAIEARLEQIAAGLGARQAQQSPLVRVMPHPQQRHDMPALDLSPDTVREGILLYFKNHCNQPCPLLNYLLQEPLSQRYPQIVLNAMLALTLRRSNLGSPVEKERVQLSLGTLAQRSWDLLTDAYRQYEFDESYFQALCLLAQVDHAEGKSDRARTQVALGLRLAQARGMLDKAHYEDREGSDYSQHQEIVWTLFILDRMFTSRHIPNSTIPECLYKLPVYNGGPTHPGQSDEMRDITCSISPAQNFMVVSLFVRMMRMWELVTQYIAESLTVHSQPIWHRKSVRTTIITHLLEFEIPSEPHSYASVGPVDRAASAPNLKPYFRTWMFFQIMHSTIHCCINHPFIIFVKARQHGSRVPLTFLQKAHKDSLIYASWVAKNLTDMEIANLDVLDPFVAYLVGIAASIHIEHSLSSNALVASSAKQKTATCMAYLTRVSRVWPKVGKRIAVLEELRSRMGNRSALHYVDDEYDGAVPVRSVRHVSMSPVDERLLWTLFDSSNDTFSHTASASRATGSASEQPDVSQQLPHDGFYDPASSILQSRGDATVSSHDAQHVSTADPLSSEMELTADWSLLGIPWGAYFPPDAEFLANNG